MAFGSDASSRAPGEDLGKSFSERRSEQVQGDQFDVWDSLDELMEDVIHACVLPFQEMS